MLITSLQTVNKTIEKSIRAEKNKLNIEGFNSYLKNINQQLESLNLCMNLDIALKEKNLCSDPTPSNINEKLKETMSICYEQVKNKNLNVSVITELQSTIGSWQQVIKDKWHFVSDTKSKPLIKSLISLKDLLDIPDKVDEITTYLKQAEQNMPKTDKALETYIHYVVMGNAIIDGMNIKTDKDIKMFIEKIRNQTATINDLTPSILDWLQKQNLKGKIKLRF